MPKALSEVLILDGDSVVQKINLEKKFIFLIIGENIYYTDGGTTQKLYLCKFSDLYEGKDLFGIGHRKVLQEHLGDGCFA